MKVDARVLEQLDNASSESVSLIVQVPAVLNEALLEGRSRGERLAFARGVYARAKQPIMAALAAFPDVKIRDLDSLPQLVVTAPVARWHALVAVGGVLATRSDAEVLPNTTFFARA
jgi:hypothetical protein